MEDETQKHWQKLTDNPTGSNQYGYVEVLLPTTKRHLILEQNLPEAHFDLTKVLQAINGL